jgi:nucleoside-diphosphate-sugar epimerase
MNAHVVIGAGPVARAVVAALVARGETATVISRSGTAVHGATAVAADITDRTVASRVLAGANVVYQCAQPEYHRWPQEFPELQRSIVDAASAAQCVLVTADNLYGYGYHAGPLVETLPLTASTRKGRTRAAMWRELEVARDSAGLRVVAARASDFFGPGVLGSFVGDRFFGPLAKGGKAEVIGRPEALHSYTYVADFGEAMVRLGETPAAWGSAWHVPNAPAVSNREFLERSAQALGVAPRSVRRSARQLRLAGLFVPPAREMIEMLYEFDENFVVDHTAYAALLGDHSTPLDTSLAATADWYRHRAKADA